VSWFFELSSIVFLSSFLHLQRSKDTPIRIMLQSFVSFALCCQACLVHIQEKERFGDSRMPNLEDGLVSLALFGKLINQLEIPFISKNSKYVVDLKAIWAFDIAVLE
jgi:hypothetical protein